VLDGRDRATRLAGALAAALGLAFAAAQPAFAHDAELHTVRPRIGPPLLSHGPDTRGQMSPARVSRRAEGGIGFGPDSAERAPVCAGSYALQVLYAKPAGERSRYREAADEIRSAIRRMDAVLNSESLASGGSTADYRVRCDAGGVISVGRFTSQGTSFQGIVSSARAAGYASPGTNYLIFFDAGAGNVCGTASLVNDDRALPGNRANHGGGYGVAYSGCWTNETPMHESAHMMGAVQYGAPRSTGSGGHCAQENDVMCYSPDGGDRNQFGAALDCPGPQRFDCGFDDYFDSAPEPGEYLWNHWNLGSPINRFLAFNAAPAQSLDEPISPLLEAGRSRAASSEAAAAPGQWRLYDLHLSGIADSLTVRLSGASAGVELYLRSRRAPTEGASACREAVRRGAAVCRVPRPRGGHWVAGVLNRGAGAGTPFDINARLRRR
jgi:hypothetical protein